MTAAATTKYLAIYLNDHLAAVTGGVELARRAAREHPDGALGAFLEQLCADLEDDRRALRGAMDALGVRPDPLKAAVAWVGEKAGRLKPNGNLREPSPLAPVVELEGLALVLEHLAMLWTAMTEIEPQACERSSALAGRAGRRRAELEPHRLDALHAAAGA